MATPPVDSSTRRPLRRIEPLRRAQGTVVLPGSKSMSNRALLLAALAQGRTRLTGLLDSDDTRVMLASLARLGVPLTVDHAAHAATVTGGVPFPARQAELFLGNAGTAIRPLTAALAVLGGDYHLSGVPRMHERPIGDLVTALRGLGAQVAYLGNEGYPPLHIGQGEARADAPWRVRGNVSSQFLTALLMAAPLCAARQGREVVIEVEGELISRPYIGITLRMMAGFGVVVREDAEGRFVVPPVGYEAPGEYTIEGDASSASYFMALGAIGGGPLRIEGVGEGSMQGDMGFADVLRDMGATVTVDARGVTASGVQVSEGGRLRAFDRDFNLIPDAAMTAAVLALYADGPCRLRNIGSWRVKETDRIAAMHAELAKLGARVESGPDWLAVWPMAPEQWRTAQIATYDDHRMAMCFSLAAFGGVAVDVLDPDCVAKTFPTYFDVFDTLVA